VEGLWRSGEEGAEIEMGAEAEAVVRSGVGVREVGMRVEVVLGLLFGGPRKAELKRIGDGEGDEDAGVLVL
jgi:hypothetical protein